MNPRIGHTKPSVEVVGHDADAIVFRFLECPKDGTVQWLTDTQHQAYWLWHGNH